MVMIWCHCTRRLPKKIQKMSDKERFPATTRLSVLSQGLTQRRQFWLKKNLIFFLLFQKNPWSDKNCNSPHVFFPVSFSIWVKIPYIPGTIKSTQKLEIINVVMSSKQCWNCLQHSIVNKRTKIRCKSHTFITKYGRPFSSDSTVMMEVKSRGLSMPFKFIVPWKNGREEETEGNPGDWYQKNVQKLQIDIGEHPLLSGVFLHFVTLVYFEQSLIISHQKIQIMIFVSWEHADSKNGICCHKKPKMKGKKMQTLVCRIIPQQKSKKNQKSQKPTNLPNLQLANFGKFEAKWQKKPGFCCETFEE